MYWNGWVLCQRSTSAGPVMLAPHSPSTQVPCCPRRQFCIVCNRTQRCRPEHTLMLHCCMCAPQGGACSSGLQRAGVLLFAFISNFRSHVPCVADLTPFPCRHGAGRPA